MQFGTFFSFCIKADMCISGILWRQLTKRFLSVTDMSSGNLLRHAVGSSLSPVVFMYWNSFTLHFFLDQWMDLFYNGVPSSPIVVEDWMLVELLGWSLSCVYLAGYVDSEGLGLFMIVKECVLLGMCVLHFEWDPLLTVQQCSLWNWASVVQSEWYLLFL